MHQETTIANDQKHHEKPWRNTSELTRKVQNLYRKHERVPSISQTTFRIISLTFICAARQRARGVGAVRPPDTGGARLEATRGDRVLPWPGRADRDPGRETEVFAPEFLPF